MITFVSSFAIIVVGLLLATQLGFEVVPKAYKDVITITVNGTAYEVTVEETGSVSAPAAAPEAAPKAAPAAAPKAAAPAAGAGAVKVTASVPGKVVKVAASVGQAVKAGDSVVILESMKWKSL